MNISRLASCRLSEAQQRLVFRDIAKTINYYSPQSEVASAEALGMVCEGWETLPPWVKRFALVGGEGTVEFRLETRGGIAEAEAQGFLHALSLELEGAFRYAPEAKPGKVFCIGWHKTGTTSLTQALRMLGYFSWHFSPWLVGFGNYRDESADARQADFGQLAGYAAFADFPISWLYRELDEAFPGSRFILTVREPASWLASAHQHAAACLEQQGCLHAIDRFAYGLADLAEPDDEVFLDKYHAHNQAVCEYFQGRKDFLALDLSLGDPWQSLCPFLGTQPLVEPFPHLNKA